MNLTKHGSWQWTWTLSLYRCPCPLAPWGQVFPFGYSRRSFLDSGPGGLCFGWQVVLCWHLRQEFPGKIVKRFFWSCWQGSKRFRVPLSRPMGREKRREGKRNRRTVLSDCISSEACTKKQKCGWMTGYFSYPLSPTQLLWQFRVWLGVLKAAQTSTVKICFLGSKGLWDLMGWTETFGMVNNLWSVVCSSNCSKI